MRTGLFALLILPAAVWADGPALYLVADRANAEGLVHKRDLVRMTFDQDGKPAAETVISLDQRFFSHFGGHRLTDDRYAVTRYGGVIDLTTGNTIATLEFTSGIEEIFDIQVVPDTGAIYLAAPPGSPDQTLVVPQ